MVACVTLPKLAKLLSHVNGRARSNPSWFRSAAVDAGVPAAQFRLWSAALLLSVGAARKINVFTLAFYDGTPPATMLPVIIAADKVAFDYFDRTASISRLMATSLPIIETLSSVLLNCKPNSRRLNG